MHGCVANVANLGGSSLAKIIRMKESAGVLVVTFVAGVMDLDILESPGTGVTEDSAVHRDMTVGSTLTPGSDHPQCPGTHTVD